MRRAKVVDAQVDGPPVTVADPGTTLVQVEVPVPTALRVEGAAVPHAALGARAWASLFSPSGGSYVFQLNRHLVGEAPQTLAVRTSPNPPPGETRW